MPRGGDQTDEGDRFIFDALREAQDGKPETGPFGATLGARPTDIIIGTDGMAVPGNGGMSVAPDSMDNLPRHKKPKALYSEGAG